MHLDISHWSCFHEIHTWWTTFCKKKNHSEIYGHVTNASHLLALGGHDLHTLLCASARKSADGEDGVMPQGWYSVRGSWFESRSSPATGIYFRFSFQETGGTLHWTLLPFAFTAFSHSLFSESAKGKGKFHPRTGHKIREGEYRCNYILSLTSAQDGAGRSTPSLGRLTVEKMDRYPLYRRLSGPQCLSGRVRKISPPGFDSRTVQSIARRYTDWAIPAHIYRMYRQASVVMCKQRAPSNHF